MGLNRTLYRVGLIGAVTMIFFTVYLIWERINQIEAIRTGFWDNLAYTTSQTDFELVRLVDAVAQSTTAGTEVAFDDLFVRYEVALSRLVGLTEGQTGQRILSNASVRDTVLSAFGSLEALEEDVLQFPSLPAVEQDAVLTALREISTEFHRATVTIASLGDQDQTSFYRTLAKSARFEILMLTLIAFAGALAFANAYLARKRFSKLNDSLAETVSMRTS